ncbi:MAG: AAA family ATPase, partial [Flavobacteriales bacterium]|nr:AAA family ATPase [Flavobacteriales bacterium]
SRACARFYWKYQLDQEEQQKIHARFKGIGEIIRLFPDTKMFDDLIEEIQNKIVLWNDNKRLFDLEGIDEAGVYLIHEIATRDYFVLSHESAQLLDKFTSFLKKKKEWNAFSNSIKKLDPIAQFKLIVKWLKAFIIDENVHDYWGLIEESAVQLMVGAIHEDHIIHVPMTLKLEGLLGTHDIIEGGNYQLNFHQFSNRLKQFERINVPMYAQYMKRKHQLTDDFKEELRLSEFMPKVMSSFVRNKLIDEVYLNVIGDNLAKQIGSAGENKRTDLMGMLLLISPPGYGKTTLMEYIANRLGIIFMKINGPAIGHQVTSLDPESANNSAAKEELEKLNLAFEMGDNVMIYLDDIQHCNPEFLQKFISLCDAQRKVEGVYKGRSKTYDLKGKKVCVVMAGNPYTESGEKFQIPDMLANRSDIYNLGDVIGDNETTFKLSYIENALTSNPILARLANKSFEDVYTFIQWAETGTKEGLDFEVSHSAEEANEYVNLLKKLLVVREVIYKVNQQYIYSAAQSDAYRTEPAFKLQGSYRNMNKIAEKLLPVMNEHELNTLILSHYENESQTLTNGAEANMLKFKELIGKLSGQELERWNTIKLKFQKNQQLKGFGESNSMGQMLLKVEDVNASLGGIQQALTQAVQGRPASVNKIGVNKQSEALEELVQALGSQSESLKAMTNHSDQRFESLMKQLIKVAENFQKPKELDDPNVDLRNNKELKKLHKALRIDVIEKGFITEQLNEYFSYGFEFHNLGKVNIQSFSGIVEFYNAKKEKLYEMDIYYKDGVPAGQSVECSTKSIYNSFSEKDNVFKEAYLDQLEVIWLPRSIEFEKGKAKAQKKSSEL